MDRSNQERFPPPKEQSPDSKKLVPAISLVIFLALTNYEQAQRPDKDVCRPSVTILTIAARGGSERLREHPRRSSGRPRYPDYNRSALKHMRE